MALWRVDYEIGVDGDEFTPEVEHDVEGEDREVALLSFVNYWWGCTMADLVQEVIGLSPDLNYDEEDPRLLMTVAGLVKAFLSGTADIGFYTAGLDDTSNEEVIVLGVRREDTTVCKECKGSGRVDREVAGRQADDTRRTGVEAAP